MAAAFSSGFEMVLTSMARRDAYGSDEDDAADVVRPISGVKAVAYPVVTYTH